MIIFSVLIQHVLAEESGVNQRRLIEITSQQIESTLSISARESNVKYTTLKNLLDLYFDRGQLYLNVGENENAFSDFGKAQKLAGILIKQSPAKDKGIIYYYLGLINKKTNDSLQAKKYLSQALKQLHPSQKEYLESLYIMGEIYFNEEKYHEAISYYSKVIQGNNKIKEQSYYNLAWSYHNIGNLSQAIYWMNTLYQKNKNNGAYQEVSQRDLVLFLVTDNQVERAVKLIQKSNRKEKLLEIVEVLIEKNQYTQALTLLTNIKGEINNKNKVITLEMQIYSLEKNYKKYNQLIKKIVKEESFFNTENSELIKNTLKNNISILHKKLKQRKNQMDYQNAITSLELLKEVEGNRSQNAFLQGEIAYDVQRYEESAGYYQECHEEAQKRGERNLEKKCMNSLMHINEQYSQDLNQKIIFYEKYLAKNPQNQKAEKMYIEIISYYLKRDIKQAIDYFYSFYQFFPHQKEKYNIFLQEILKEIDRTQNQKKLLSFIEKIENFNLNPQLRAEIEKKKNYLKIKMAERYKKENRDEKALEEYANLYDQSRDNTIKNSALYQIILLKIKKNLPLDEKKLRDLLKTVSYRQLIKTNILNLIEHRLFADKSSFLEEWYQQTYQLSCQNKDQKMLEKSSWDLFYYYLTQDKVHKAYSGFKRDQKCMLAKQNIKDKFYKLVNALLLSGKEELALNYIITFSMDFGSTKKNIEYIYRIYKETKNKKMIKLIQEYFKKNKANSQNSADIYAKFYYLKLKQHIKKINTIQFSFPESKFNSILKNYLENIGKANKLFSQIIAIGGGETIVQTYFAMINLYNVFAKKIKNFKPVSTDVHYIKSFAQNMNKFRQNSLKKKKFLTQEMIDFVQKQKIYFSSADYLLFTKALK